MLTAPYLAAHHIWLHSRKCGVRSTTHPGNAGSDLGACNLDNLNSYCRRLVAKHQCTMRGDAWFALQPDELVEAPPS